MKWLQMLNWRRPPRERQNIDRDILAALRIIMSTGEQVKNDVAVIKTALAETQAAITNLAGDVDRLTAKLADQVDAETLGELASVRDQAVAVRDALAALAAKTPEDGTTPDTPPVPADPADPEPEVGG